MANYSSTMDYNISVNISDITNGTTSPGLSQREDSDSNAKYINSMINIICRPILIIIGTIGKYNDCNFEGYIQKITY